MKTILKISAIMFAVAVIFSVSSCSKDAGPGGKKRIYGTVTNLDGAVENAIVRIAYDAAEATTEFNNSTTTDASGAYSFEKLNKGDYYIDAEYTDALGFSFTSEGATVAVMNKKKKEEIMVDIVFD